MLNSIQSPGAANPETEDALALLLGCHDRIRHFTRVSVRLAESPQAPAPDRIDAARAVLRYYTIALPLHEDDENNSVYPRLKRVLPSGELAHANQQMLDQHAGIDANIAELVPMWQQIERDPRSQDSLGDRLQYCTEKLRALWNVHLALEENQVIPAMRKYLDASDLAEIAREMQARRQAATSR
jgi:hemerythrin-like domain-containing protein